MQIETKYFGTVEYEAEELITFPKGLFGFEEEHSFLLLPFSQEEDTLLSLQSTTTPPLSFLLMNPFALDPSYAPQPSQSELGEMGVERSEDLFYYVMCVVKEPVSESTVNLRCPVLMREETRQAMQVILEDCPYHMRHRLAEFGAGEGGAPC